MADILLIEDAPQVAGILISKLGREGYKLEWRRTRAEARAALDAGSYSLILLSTYLLPGRDAWQILEDVKAHPRQGGVPTIMLLDAEEADQRERALAAGASGVIMKPFKPTAVARVVRSVVPPAALAS